MGYTHYYDNLKLTPEYADAIAQIVACATTHGVIIRNGVGEDYPTINKNIVCLNGDGENDLNHETFYLSANKPNTFAFTKTAQKPYDAIVVASLIWAILHEVPGWQSIASDGNFDEWNCKYFYDNDYHQIESINGIKLYEEIFGKITPDEVLKIRRLIG